jgi:hypothetical protein
MGQVVFKRLVSFLVEHLIRHWASAGSRTVGFRFHEVQARRAPAAASAYPSYSIGLERTMFLSLRKQGLRCGKACERGIVLCLPGSTRQ